MNTMWHMEKVGVLRLGDTNIHIHLSSDWSTGHRFEVRWNTRVVDRSWSLDNAKYQAEKWLKDLKEMGFYPG